MSEESRTLVEELTGLLKAIGITKENLDFDKIKVLVLTDVGRCMIIPPEYRATDYLVIWSPLFLDQLPTEEDWQEVEKAL